MTRILVAESDFSTITDLENFLSDPKFALEFAGSATEAAEIFAEQKFDLVVVGAVGWEKDRISVEHFLARVARAKIPILILLDDFKKETKKCGLPNCDYLRKSFSKKDLLAKIRAN